MARDTEVGVVGRSPGERTFGAIAWSALAGALALFAATSDRGLDLTDESFYLLSFRFPDSTPAGIWQFPHIASALTFGRTLDARGYRLLAIAALALASTSLTLATVRFLEQRLPTLHRTLPSRPTLVAFGVTVGLLQFAWLPRTLSYYTLAAALGQLAAAAVLMAVCPPGVRVVDLRSVAFGVTAGALLFLLFFADFPAAIAVGALVTAFLFLTVQVRSALVLAGAIAAGVVVCAVFLTRDLWGGPFDARGLLSAIPKVANNQHGAGTLIAVYLEELRTIGLLTVPSLTLGLLFAAPRLAEFVASAHRRRAAIALSVPAPLGIAAAVPGWFADANESYFRAFFTCSSGVVVGFLIVVAANHVEAIRSGQRRRRVLPAGRGEARTVVALVGFLVALPVATSVGTNNVVFLVAMNAAGSIACAHIIAWAIREAAFPDSAPGAALRFGPLVALTLITGILLVHGGIMNPYRVGTNLFEQDQLVSGIAGGDLLLDRGRATTLISVRDAIHSIPSFRPGDPIVVGGNLEGFALVAGGRIPGSQYFSDDPDAMCPFLAAVPDDLARTNIVIRSTREPSGFDACFHDHVPGFPDAFEVKATIPGGLMPGSRADPAKRGAPPGIEILVRRGS